MSKSNKCPICEHDNPLDKKLCENCGWCIPLQLENFIEDSCIKLRLITLKNIEKWAVNIWKTLQEEKQQRKELQIQLEQYNDDKYAHKISKLEEDVKKLSTDLGSKIDNERMDKLLSELTETFESKLTENMEEVNKIIQEKIENIINSQNNYKQELENKIAELEERLKQQLSSINYENQEDDVEQYDNVGIETEETETPEDSQVSLPDSDNSTNKNHNKKVTIDTPQLSQEEKWVITCYGEDSSKLLNHADSVSITEETINKIWKSEVDQIIFEQSLDENEYWLFRMRNSASIYLVPAHDLIINNNFKVVKNIFQLINFSTSNQEQKYKLIKPAKVIRLPDGKWRLIKTGILQF